MEFVYSGGVRQALAAARAEAIELRHPYVATEHILLGLMNADGVAPQALRVLGRTPKQVRAAILRMLQPGDDALHVSGELPYTSRAKKTLEFAMEEARLMAPVEPKKRWRRPQPVGVAEEHLLLGLMREEKGVAAIALTSLGVTLDKLRLALATRSGLESESQSESESGFRVAIDDTSEKSIYEQIVQQIREAVATGELPSGERLPTVRRLADELDVAPGTVARAYGELEQLGVVVTDGARGTRVADRPEAQKQRPPTDDLAGLLRPVAVAAYHMGADADGLRDALEAAMDGIFDRPAGG